MFTVRRAKESDLDRLLEIHTACFPDPRGHADRTRNFRSNPLGALTDLRVALMDGVPVAHAFLFPLRAYFGGRAASIGGIASVGVAPEARGRGVGHRLVAQLHAEADAAGWALTLLYAFRQHFYARLGYASVQSHRRLLLTPAAFPRAWAEDASLVVRGARGTNRPAMESAYQIAAQRGTGVLERSPGFWERLLADERRTWLVASRGAVVTGYVCLSIIQAESHADTRADVHELIALDAPTRRRLLGALGVLRGQVEVIELDVDAADPLEFALVDPDGHRRGTARLEHSLGAVVGGPMIRIVDTVRALAARGYAADGAFTFQIDEAAEPIRLVVRDGVPAVAHVGDGPPERGSASSLRIVPRAAPSSATAITVAAVHAPTMRLSATTLAAMAYGSLRPSHAAALGLLTVDGDSDLFTEADALFALPPFFSLDPF